jgi:hypothetical protein
VFRSRDVEQCTFPSHMFDLKSVCLLSLPFYVTGRLRNLPSYPCVEELEANDQVDDGIAD